MISIFKPVLLATLMSGAAYAASAQPTVGEHEGNMMAPGGAMMQGQGRERMGKMSPQHMQARMEKRAAELKASLKLSADQEAAWITFTNAMTPPTEKAGKRVDRAELAKLSTPERLDKMKALRLEHEATLHAAMDERALATKAFYATLSAEQKKIFDAQSMAHQGHKGPKGRPADANS